MSYPPEILNHFISHYQQRLVQAKSKGISAWKEVRFLDKTLKELSSCTSSGELKM